MSRTTALVWAAVAFVLLGAVLLLCLISPSVRDDIGSPVAVGVLVAGLGCLLVAVAAGGHGAMGARWALAVLLAVAAGAMAVVGLAGMTGSGSAGVGLLLVLAAVAMSAVAAQIPRAGTGRAQPPRKGTR